MSLQQELTGFEDPSGDRRLHFGFSEAMSRGFDKLLNASKLYKNSDASDQINVGLLEKHIRALRDTLTGFTRPGSPLPANPVQYLNILYTLHLMYNIWDSVHDFKKGHRICETYILEESFQNSVKIIVQQVLRGARGDFVGKMAPQQMLNDFMRFKRNENGNLYADGATTLANSYIFYFFMLVTFLSISHVLLGDKKSHLELISSQGQPPEDKFAAISSVIYDALALVLTRNPELIRRPFIGYQIQQELLGWEKDNSRKQDQIDARIRWFFQNFNKRECLVYYPNNYKDEPKRNKFAIYQFDNMRGYAIANISTGKLAKYFESNTPQLMMERATFEQNVKGLLGPYGVSTIDCCIPIILNNILDTGMLREVQTVISILDGRNSTAGLNKYEFSAEAPSHIFEYLRTALRHRNQQWDLNLYVDNIDNIDIPTKFTFNATYNGNPDPVFNITLTQNDDDYIMRINDNSIGNLYDVVNNLASINNMKTIFDTLKELGDGQTIVSSNHYKQLPVIYQRMITDIFPRILLSEKRVPGPWSWVNYKDKINSFIPFVRYMKFMCDLMQPNKRSMDQLAATCGLLLATGQNIMGKKMGPSGTPERIYVMHVLYGGFAQRLGEVQTNLDPLLNLCTDEDALIVAERGMLDAIIDKFVMEHNMRKLNPRERESVKNAYDMEEGDLNAKRVARTEILNRLLNEQKQQACMNIREDRDNKFGYLFQVKLNTTGNPLVDSQLVDGIIVIDKDSVVPQDEELTFAQIQNNLRDAYEAKSHELRRNIPTIVSNANERIGWIQSNIENLNNDIDQPFKEYIEKEFPGKYASLTAASRRLRSKAVKEVSLKLPLPQVDSEELNVIAGNIVRETPDLSKRLCELTSISPEQRQARPPYRPPVAAAPRRSSVDSKSRGSPVVPMSGRSSKSSTSPEQRQARPPYRGRVPRPPAAAEGSGIVIDLTNDSDSDASSMDGRDDDGMEDGSVGRVSTDLDGDYGSSQQNDSESDDYSAGSVDMFDSPARGGPPRRGSESDRSSDTGQRRSRPPGRSQGYRDPAAPPAAASRRSPELSDTEQWILKTAPMSEAAERIRRRKQT